MSAGPVQLMFKSGARSASGTLVSLISLAFIFTSSSCRSVDSPGPADGQETGELSKNPTSTDDGDAKSSDAGDDAKTPDDGDEPSGKSSPDPDSEGPEPSEKSPDKDDDSEKGKDDSTEKSEGGSDELPLLDGLPDMKQVDLLVDLESKTAQATVQFSVEKKVTRVRFEVGDLENVEVFAKKKKLKAQRKGKILKVELPKSSGDSYTFDFEYAYSLHKEWEGVMNTGTTMLWPYYCGNVYPCRSHPIDGVKYSLELMEAKETAVYPEKIDAQAPAYQLAWAIGDFKRIDRGETAAGTKVEVWHLAGREAEAEKGTKHLKEYVSWLEETYGDYMFGDSVASVEADWGGSTPYGGMEHHPMWHVSKGSFADPSVHAHEAAHGWFGDGVRIECWGDFVLSEGTVSYLTARAIEAVDGKAAGDKVWAGYISGLKSELPKAKIKKAWHPGCEDIDIKDGYFSGLPYNKGALFFRALERAVGREDLDEALRKTYETYKGKAATFGDLLDIVKATTKFDPMPCAKVWLRRDEAPDLEASCKDLK